MYNSILFKKEPQSTVPPLILGLGFQPYFRVRVTAATLL